jgi:hypothetical protein
VPTTVPAGVAARVHRVIEPLHAMVYFAPEAEKQLTTVGLRPGRMCYFASRSAPMGAVTSGVSAATFYNFNPELVARHIPLAWTLTTPDAVLRARLATVDESLRRLLGDDVIGSDELTEAAALARGATVGLDPAGRPLFAAHAELAWPDEPHVALWHAFTLLREHRGDGHLAALLAEGLSGIEAIVTHTATGRGFTEDSAKNGRGWSDEQWAASVATLRDSGVLNRDSLTLAPAGVALRERIESQTDLMAAAPLLELGDERTARLIELGATISNRAISNGAFPDGVFATPRSAD